MTLITDVSAVGSFVCIVVDRKYKKIRCRIVKLERWTGFLGGCTVLVWQKKILNHCFPTHWRLSARTARKNGTRKCRRPTPTQWVPNGQESMVKRSGLRFIALIARSSFIRRTTYLPNHFSPIHEQASTHLADYRYSLQPWGNGWALWTTSKPHRAYSRQLAQGRNR